jgi:hypothetical protein
MTSCRFGREARGFKCPGNGLASALRQDARDPHHPTAPTTSGRLIFVFDTLADGRSIKCLTVIDEWAGESMAIDVASGIRAARVVKVLARVVSVRSPHRNPRLRATKGKRERDTPG